MRATLQLLMLATPSGWRFFRPARRGSSKKGGGGMRIFILCGLMVLLPIAALAQGGAVCLFADAAGTDCNPDDTATRPKLIINAPAG
jgi:hypothetical protein